MADNCASEPMNEDTLTPGSAHEEPPTPALLESEVVTAMDQDSMDVSEALHTAERSLTLGDMPEEILEHILGFLSPYRDMEAAKQVSHQWNRVIKSTVKQKRRRFYQGLSKCDVQWTEIHKEKLPNYSEKGHIGISDRFSHSAAYLNGLMYVFGGCTSTSTTFNDLWSFDLTHRRWVRPVAMGTYPSPKACATMVVYNGNLVLFGGWSHPIPYPLHQSAHYFSELHVYSPASNRWSHVHSLGQEPEGLGGHSASVAGHLMVVFGGSPRPGFGTNNLWVFNFQKGSWTLQPVCHDAIPEPRYGQYQTTLDDSHILVMGGCVGHNRVFTDVWLLTLERAAPWRWTRLTVECPELGSPQTWCHAACRVTDMIVVVSKSKSQRQTRQVKQAKRKHRDRSRNAKPSSPPLPPSASASEAGADKTSGSGVTCEAPGVFVHPKLQPQPVRGEEMRDSKGPVPKSDTEGCSAAKNSRSPLPGQGSTGTHPEACPSQILKASPASTSNTASSSLTSHHSVTVSDRSTCVASSLSTSSGVKPLAVQHASSTAGPAASGNSLLALQQRLHRECMNLPDPDNHHHVPRPNCRHGIAGVGATGLARLRSASLGEMAPDGDDNNDDGAMPEGYFHRLENRYMGGGQGAGETAGRSQLHKFQQQHSPNVLSPTTVSSPPSSNAASSEQASQHERPEDVREISRRATGAVPGGAPFTSSIDGNSENSTRPVSPTSSGATSNSFSQQGDSLTSSHEHPHHHHHHHQQSPALPQPSPGVVLPATRPLLHTTVHPRAHLMPAVRPNASSNRQRQLEALQRQEELLRSKSRALAAARGRQPEGQQLPPQHQQQQQQEQPHHEQQQQQHDLQQQHVQGAAGAEQGQGRPRIHPEEREKIGGVGPRDRKNLNDNDNNDDGDEDDDDDDDDDEGDPSVPVLVPTKNKMDLHILDISRALTEGVVRWGPLSELQPPGAPDETICCSLVEGRAELALFGGVRREVGGPAAGRGSSNMAISRLFLLHPE